MASKPFFSGRIPRELYDRVNEHAAKTGVAKTDILINALAAYLDFPIQRNSSFNSALEERVTDLEQRFTILDGLSKEVLELRQIIAPRKLTSDNKLDNQPDNIIHPGQLSFLGQDNAVDNTSDNEKAKEEHPVTGERASENWNLLGNMHIPEIVNLPGLEDWDKAKLKQKLRNVKTYKLKQEAVIDIYLFKLVGQDSGIRKQMIFEVYRKKLPEDWV